MTDPYICGGKGQLKSIDLLFVFGPVMMFLRREVNINSGSLEWRREIRLKYSLS